MRSFIFSLTLRFALLLSATTLGVLLLVGWLLHDQGLRSLEVLHDGEFHELSEILHREPTLTAQSINARIGQDTDSDAGLYYTEIRSLEGDLLFRSSKLNDKPLPQGGLPGTHFTELSPRFGDLRVSVYNDGRLRYTIASPLAPLEGVMEGYAGLATMLFLGTSALGAFVSYLFARMTQQPLRLIREAALDISAENLGRRIPLPKGQDELTALTVLLNQMFDRLQTAFEQNRSFAADASHELKTPLSVLRLQAEKLRPLLSENASGLSQLEEILEEAAHMHRIIESLLFLAKAESGTLTVPFRKQGIAPLVSDLEADALVLAEDAGVRVELVQEGDALIDCEPTLLYQMAINVISNAIRYCEKEGLVSIRSTVVGSLWLFEVSDEGPGVAPEQIGRLFKRFQRLGAETESGGGFTGDGHGLGLAITKGIVGLHGGTIEAHNRSERRGLRVCVRLPLGGPRSAEGTLRS